MKSRILIVLFFLTASSFIMAGAACAGEEAGKGISFNKGTSKDYRKTGIGFLDMQKLSSSHPEYAKQKEIIKVLGVFERRIDDQNIISKVRHKLITINENRLHMISSLSDRIIQEDGLEDTIAFLLLTTLVIFS